MRRPGPAGSCSEADLTGQANTRDCRPGSARYCGGRVRVSTFRTTTAMQHQESSLSFPGARYTGPLLGTCQTLASVRGRGVLLSMSLKPYSFARPAATNTFPV